MKKLLILGLCITSFLFATENARILTIVAEGEHKAPPDVVYLSLGVEETAANARDSQRKQKEALRRVLDALENNDISKEKIKTTNYNIFPIYSYQDKKRKLDGYKTTATLLIEIDDLISVGQILDSTVAAGVNRVDSIKFSLKNKESAEDEALRKAIKRAKEKVILLATGMGISVGKIVNVQEQSVAHSPYSVTALSLDRSAGSDAAALPSGLIKVKAGIVVQYEIVN